MTNPLLEKLGYGSDARLVILHADDVGMCHGANQAYLDLSAGGMVRSGSVMVPCPWAPEILHTAADNPELDLGVHLTLTCEWSEYRWGPLTSRESRTGMIDGESCFWPSVEAFVDGLDLDAAKMEMRAQIERVKDAGVDFTHIDGHMGAPMVPGLREYYVQLGLEYQVPVMLFRGIDEPMRAMGYDDKTQRELDIAIPQLEAAGLLFPDYFRITPLYGFGVEHPSAEVYESLLRGLSPGVTYFSLHPNAPGDIEWISPEAAQWRTFEHRYFRSDRLRQLLEAENIVPIGYREIRDAMRAA